MIVPTASNGSRIAYQFESFAGYPLVHGMSGRLVDEASEGDTGFAPGTSFDEIERNRAAFLADLNLSGDALTIPRQTHATNVAVAQCKDRGRGRPPAFDGFPATDALVTANPGIALGVIVADCVPIVLYDPIRHALGVVHSGWRGTVGHIAARAVEKMTREFGSVPNDIVAGIGPSIGPCCYEVGPEVSDAWIHSGIEDPSWALKIQEPRPYFDLWQANRQILLGAGVESNRIARAEICTRCASAEFFSHRAAMAGERPRGRMLMVAQLLEAQRDDGGRT